MPRRLLLGWGLLMALLAIQFGASFLALPPWPRVLLLVPAAGMAATIAFLFMDIASAPVIARGFAAAGLLWLVVLLGLGSMDPLTRTDYQVPAAHRD